MAAKGVSPRQSWSGESVAVWTRAAETSAGVWKAGLTLALLARKPRNIAASWITVVDSEIAGGLGGGAGGGGGGGGGGGRRRGRGRLAGRQERHAGEGEYGQGRAKALDGHLTGVPRLLGQCRRRRLGRALW